MSDEELPPLLQACSSCNALLDVSDQEPFAQVHCPICGQGIRARTQFNNFAIQEPLGQGGMGAVYKALDVNLNRLVALKVVKREFSANPEYVASFEREAVITASVNHPHVVKVFSFGSDRGTYYIAMELVEKGSLDNLMTLQGTVAEAQVLQVGIQIASGLNAALQLGLIHRDVKPGNILFAEAGVSKIVDFGLALLMQEEAEASGEIWGTPYYIAPEKLNRQPEDFRSDIYSLGGTLFHALAGRPPFEAETASMVALKHIKSKAVSLQSFAPDISSPTAYVINRMLCKEPDERYQSYEELIEHLTYARAQLLESKAKPRVAKQVVLESKSEQVMSIIIALLLLVAVGALGYFGWKYRSRVFPATETVEQLEGAKKKQASGNAARRFEELRTMLIGGDFASAQAGFHELGSGETAVEQPLKNWASMNEGLCVLLSGKLQEAQGIFGELGGRGMYSAAPQDAPLGNFFLETSRLVGTPDPVSASTAGSYANGDLDALSLLAFALKNWELKDMESAQVLFAQFTASKISESMAWIEGYKPLVRDYVQDLQTYAGLKAEADAATTPAQQTALVAKIRAARDELKHGGKMVDVMTDLQARVQVKAQQAQAQESQQTLVARTQEEKTMAQTAQFYRAELGEFRCENLAESWRALTLTDPSQISARARMVKKADWLAAFKLALVSAVNGMSYPLPLARRHGSLAPAPITSATSESVSSKNQYGGAVVPWSEIEPKSIVEMATFYRARLASESARNQLAWTSGVYAYEVGLQSAGRDLLLEASQNDTAYRDQLALFFN